MAEPDKERCYPLWAVYAMTALVGCLGVVVFGREALAPILVVTGALTLVTIRSTRSDERLRKSQELELEPLVPRDSEEGRVLNRELVALAFCIDELEKRTTDAGSQHWIWKTKRRVARLIRQEWDDRIDWQPDAVLTDDEKEDLLAQHPLLSDRHADVPDPAERYAHEQWYKEIRTEVMQFVTKERARAF